MQEIEQIYTQYRQDVYRYLCSLTPPLRRTC